MDGLASEGEEHGRQGREFKLVFLCLQTAADKLLLSQIHFVPDWNDVNLVPQNKWGGGAMSWAAWGDKGRTTAMTTASDQAYIAAASKANLAYLAPVAAFFFVHVAASNNYVLNSNDFLLPKHYADLIALSPGPAYVELLSWNDFGESHYLGPIRSSAGVPSGATAYADAKHDHLPMLWLSTYYNVWFKSGSPPPISTECVVWWYRPHPAKASTSGDPLSAPQYAGTLDDKLFAAVFIPQGSKAKKLVFTAGGQAHTAQDVEEGVNLVSVAFQAGKTSLSLVDGSGKQVLAGSGADIVATPRTFDFNFRSYILPQDATASKCFGTGAVSPAPLPAPSGAATTATASALSPTSSKDASTASGEPSATVLSNSPPSPPLSSGSPASSGASPDTSSLASSGASSDLSSTADRPSGWLGVPTYGWIVGAAILLVLLLLLVVAANRTKPAEREQGRQTTDESVSRDSNSSDSESSDSEDGLISRRRNGWR
ncbi:glucan endo-1,3-alpha-glucosidase, glycoside hydrolase family 71 protein [Rhodotorula toruloides]|uniref:Glucan endo-1,3-alpha-glucosidase, glycoside hydrolase family 71 protein n=1 Tax=Rhodotorula toruloides TaxID=5286 RepID=A0A511KIH4_RHOTO|nr:glucan endo-1,3-alpha-glucosidase, glycoside hydrolase family 71 protein [Rhodotorula toruloides]